MSERSLFDRKPRRASLGQVAKSIVDCWRGAFSDENRTPPCPTPRLLKRLLEQLNYASGLPEEGRYPKFNIIATSADNPVSKTWRLGNPRPVTFVEFRRLLPTTDAHKSALVIEWTAEETMAIVGLVDMGSSWHLARLGLGYRYDVPSNLIVEVERPNRFNIYQGQFRLATFSDGEFDMPWGLDMPLFLHDPANAALADLSSRLVRPLREPPKEYYNFEFVALWNCYAGIANSIALASHGGTVIIQPSTDMVTEIVKIKYPLYSSLATDAFVAFLNARHRSGDRWFDRDMGKRVTDGELAKLDRAWLLKFDELVESIRFVAGFARCDGAVIMSRTLEVVGFGCELKATLATDREVRKILRNVGTDSTPLDVEQFGMRHRSAIKYVSQYPDAVALVVSQDGPITGIWSEHSDGPIMVRTEQRLVSLNIPWS